MKEKTLKTFGNIPQDKLLHFFYGTIISFIAVLIFSIKGLWITVVIAAAKELIYDKLMKKGNCDILDFVFTCIPCIMFLIIYYDIYTR